MSITRKIADDIQFELDLLRWHRQPVRVKGDQIHLDCGTQLQRTETVSLVDEQGVPRPAWEIIHQLHAAIDVWMWADQTASWMATQERVERLADRVGQYPDAPEKWPAAVCRGYGPETEDFMRRTEIRVADLEEGTRIVSVSYCRGRREDGVFEAKREFPLA